jgi:CHAD domain-containing protein
MRAIRQATNAARDDDVLLARLDSSAMAEVVVRLQEDRRAARRGVHALCRRLAGDAKLARRMGDLSSKTRGRRGEEYAATPFGAWARTRLARSAERFFAVAFVDVADVDELHELRRRTKRLRYEVEILAGVLPGWLRSETYPILTELQDRLGAVNDHAVAVRCLRRLARTQPAGNSIGALDASVVESESALTKARDDFAAWWTSDRRDSLQRDFSRLL